ncbi:MAG: hypothetical protein V1809_05745 [Planctomycetota bacterium]
MRGRKRKSLDHLEGYPNERKYLMILARARRDCPSLKDRVVRRIIAGVAPDFEKDLFVARPCARVLRYIGNTWAPEMCRTDGGFFAIGRLYESIGFNGATYTIQGYKRGRERIGSAHFEYVKPLLTTHVGGNF